MNQLLTFLDGVEASMQGGDGLQDKDGATESEFKSNDNNPFSKFRRSNRSSTGSSNHVMIVATSSRPIDIDPALLRPGRIEKHVFVDYPDENDKKEILEIYLKQYMMESNPINSIPPGVKQTIEEISSSSLSANYSASDLKGLIEGSYLAGVKEKIAKRLQSDGTEGKPSQDTDLETENGSLISPDLLRAAFSKSRPSLSAQDLAHYKNVFRQFRDKGGDGQNHEAGVHVSKNSGKASEHGPSDHSKLIDSIRNQKVTLM